MSALKDVCAAFITLIKGLTNKAFQNHDSEHRALYCAICEASEHRHETANHIGANEARFVIIANSIPFRICPRHHPNPKIGEQSHELDKYFRQNDLIWTDLYVMDRNSRTF